MWTALLSYQWGLNYTGLNWPYYLQGLSFSLSVWCDERGSCFLKSLKCTRIDCLLLLYCDICPVCLVKISWILLVFLADFKSKFELERKDTDCYNTSTTSGSQQQQQQHQSPLLPLPTPPHHFSSSSSSSAGVSGAGGVPIATPAHLPDSTTDSWSGYYGTQRQDGVSKPFSSKSASGKQRCRDYDGTKRENPLSFPSVNSCFLSVNQFFFHFCLTVCSSISQSFDVEPTYLGSDMIIV